MNQDRDAELRREVEAQFEAIKSHAPVGVTEMLQLQQRTAELLAQNEAYFEILNPVPRFTVLDGSAFTTKP